MKADGVNTKEMVSVEKDLGFDPNCDTLLFGLVNTHAEEMAEKRRIEDYERLKRDERIRQMRAMQEKKNKVISVMNIFKNLVFLLCVIFLIWVFMSWVNVISHNTQPGGYDLIWSWNFFKVFFGQ